MIQVRINQFETNSSSTHCLVLMTDDDFEKWTAEYDNIDEQVFWNEWESGNHSDDQKFITGKEIRDMLIKDGMDPADITDEDIKEKAGDEGYKTLDDIGESYEYDSISENGITAFSYSGWD